MSVPSLPRGVRLHEDRVRGCTVLLGPERTVMLDEIGVAILREVDGLHSIAAISEQLAQRYGAPSDAVRGDVETFIAGLADRRLVDLA